MNFIDSVFSATTGVSTSTIQHKGKLYTGTAKLHPEDAAKVSRFAGCILADLRAQVKALKAELKEEKANCEAIRKFVKACTYCKNWDPTSATAKVVYRQLNIKIKRVNELIDMINAKEQAIFTKIHSRDAVLKALEQQKAKNS
jgi:hypothetical protein